MIAEASGTQNAVIGTEHLLATFLNGLKSYVLKVDTSAMQLGDTLEIRIYDTIGSVSVLAYGPPEGCTSGGAQPVPAKISVPVPSDVECHFTLKQTAGTGRAFPWKVLSL